MSRETLKKGRGRFKQRRWVGSQTGVRWTVCERVKGQFGFINSEGDRAEYINGKYFLSEDKYTEEKIQKKFL